MKPQRKGNPEPVTAGVPSPADFPVGSVESRAAARAVAEALDTREGIVTIRSKATPERVREIKEKIESHRPRGSAAAGPMIRLIFEVQEEGQGVEA